MLQDSEPSLNFFIAATERGVKVKLMLSERAYTYKHRVVHLKSLLEVNKQLNQKLIEIKVFHVSACLIKQANHFPSLLFTFIGLKCVSFQECS